MDRRLFICFVLLFFIFVLVACGNHGEKVVPPDILSDNSPDEYIFTGYDDNSVYDTTGMPRFSHAPGVYQNAISVAITCENPGYIVRYTADCSLPTTESPVYDQPFYMEYGQGDDNNSNVTVYNIRAASFDKEGKMIGRVVSASYLFTKDGNRFSTKIISLVTANENLYGSNGIIDNAINRGRTWERPVNFQLYSPDGRIEVQQDLGIRTNGTGSRLNIQKNFRLFARREYTEETGHLLSALFPGLVSEYYGAQIEEFDTFLVRGGSTNLHDTMITNLIAYELMEDSRVDVANFEPAALFINGEYYGLMMIIEDYSPYYFESHYGVDEEKIATINFTVVSQGPYAGLNWEPDDCTTQEYEEWAAVRHFLETKDMTQADNYTAASKMIDIENFIQYITYECYLNNWDWPRNNQRVWRYTGVSGDNASHIEGVGGYDPDAEYGFDGRWRFVAKDLDISQGVNAYPELGYYAPIDTDFFQVMSKDYNSQNRTYEIFRNLMFNEGFCRSFYLYVCEFMSTRVEVDTYLEIINRLALQIADEMQYHCQKYGDTLRDWDKDIHSMRQFAEQRPAYVLDDINVYSARKGHGYTMVTMELTDITGGSIRYNNATFTKSTKIYSLRDLSMPLEIIPDPGFEVGEVIISGGSYNNGMLTLSEYNCVLNVSFIRTGQSVPKKNTPDHIVINEIGHSSQEKVNGYDWIELYNPTDHDINLRGYTLTGRSKSHTFPSIVVPAGGFKVIFCSGTQEGGVYAPFTIAKGNILTLYDSGGAVIDKITIQMIASKTHLGRYPDGGEWKELSQYNVSPNAPNSFLEGIYHYYGEKVQNAVMINGILIDKSLFEITDDGKMTTTLSKLLTAQDLTTLEKSSLNMYLKMYQKDEIIDMNTMLELHRIKEDFSVYYVAALNSYIITF